MSGVVVPPAPPWIAKATMWGFSMSWSDCSSCATSFVWGRGCSDSIGSLYAVTRTKSRLFGQAVEWWTERHP